MGRVTNFLAAADAVTELVARIPEAAYDGPGLGAWDLRALVGHTSRSFVTLLEYSGKKGTFEEEVPSPQEYYVIVAGMDTLGEAVVERGVQAGRDLGEDPAAAYAELTERARRLLDSADLDRVVPTLLGGMRLRAYLPTRTFELIVHGGDIARATGLPFEPPPDALGESVTLAARVAVLLGHGEPLLEALTGRAPLPDSVRVV